MPVDSVGGGQTAEIILDETPFYAESGGQVGDTGTLTSPSGVARVLDTYSPVRGVIVHKVQTELGTLALNGQVQAQVDEERRFGAGPTSPRCHTLPSRFRRT